VDRWDNQVSSQEGGAGAPSLSLSVAAAYAEFHFPVTYHHFHLPFSHSHFHHSRIYSRIGYHRVRRKPRQLAQYILYIPPCEYVTTYAQPPIST
jgi:uncharacterized protein YqjF (DUF2071 family)